MPFARESVPRYVSLVLVALVLAGVWADPYTFYYNASDLVEPGPLWQLLIGVIDVSLLAGSLAMLWRRRYDRAFELLVVEALWAISAALILMDRDGMGRFIRGFGAQQYLTEYLTLMALRFAAMGCLWRAGRRASSITVDPAAQG